MPEKKEIYRRVKIAGMLSFIPIVLASGPLAGFFLGEYLVRKFNLAEYTQFICIGIGFITSAREVFRIISAVVKITKDQ